MVETILVSGVAFCASGTAVALVLCGAARGAARPVPTKSEQPAEEDVPVAQAR